MKIAPDNRPCKDKRFIYNSKVDAVSYLGSLFWTLLMVLTDEIQIVVATSKESQATLHILCNFWIEPIS